MTALSTWLRKDRRTTLDVVKERMRQDVVAVEEFARESNGAVESLPLEQIRHLARRLVKRLAEFKAEADAAAEKLTEP